MRVVTLVILFFVTCVLCVLLLMQLGLFGMRNKITTLLGVTKNTTLQIKSYNECTEKGGLVEVRLPRVCSLHNQTVYEEYAADEELSYKNTVEKEAASQNHILLRPLNVGKYNQSVQQSQSSEEFPYRVQYSISSGKTMLTASITHRDIPGASFSQYEKVLNSNDFTSLNDALGGNSIQLLDVSFASTGITKGKVFVDGKGSELYAPLSVFIVGTIRENGVVLSAPLQWQKRDAVSQECTQKFNASADVTQKNTALECFRNAALADTVLTLDAQRLAKLLASQFVFE